MTQGDAAKILWVLFYDWVPAPWNPKEQIRMLKVGTDLVLEHEATQEEFDRRRDELLPKDFRFEWQHLPAGARRIGGRPGEDS